ncbi:hypothetical protein SLEP1_g51263 [Rubroshorea leprosula]|uniref:Uncharacterized protein n=1 Tax=Rubroshorea leprosula TaxID=152421 RepID=A0AAV5M5W3_9ROSI|nr:hypothetical protein SLEP1_g51263 [Rubroshorea leprosula]
MDGSQHSSSKNDSRAPNDSERNIPCPSPAKGDDTNLVKYQYEDEADDTKEASLTPPADSVEEDAPEAFALKPSSLRMKLVEMIILDGYPLSIVEHFADSAPSSATLCALAAKTRSCAPLLLLTLACYEPALHFYLPLHSTPLALLLHPLPSAPPILHLNTPTCYGLVLASLAEEQRIPNKSASSSSFAFAAEINACIENGDKKEGVLLEGSSGLGGDRQAY